MEKTDDGMRLLLITDGRYSTKTYEKQLKGWGVDLLVEKSSFSRAEWRDGKLTPKWLSETAAEIYTSHGSSVDFVQFLFKPKNWKNRTRGTHYGIPRSTYEIGAIKYRKKWEDTGGHELMHAFDDFVFTYLGHWLDGVVGVTDFDKDVVHGRSAKYKEYEYDEPYAIIRPYVIEAARKRKEMNKESYSSKLGVLVRSLDRKLAGETIT